MRFAESRAACSAGEGLGQTRTGLGESGLGLAYRLSCGKFFANCEKFRSAEQLEACAGLGFFLRKNRLSGALRAPGAKAEHFVLCQNPGVGSRGAYLVEFFLRKNSLFWPFRAKKRGPKGSTSLLAGSISGPSGLKGLGQTIRWNCACPCGPPGRQDPYGSWLGPASGARKKIASQFSLVFRREAIDFLQNQRFCKISAKLKFYHFQALRA